MELATKNKEDELAAGKEQSAKEGGGEKKPRKPRKKMKKKWIVLGVVLIVIIAVVVIFANSMNRSNSMTESIYTYAQAEMCDISSTLTGSGTLEPADSYTVTTLVSGDILSADFEEGDVVSKDDVLYQLDSSDASTSIERAEISLGQTQRNYSKKVENVYDLTLTAPISGTITGLIVSSGDTVGTQTAIATIENTSTLKLTEYYSNEYSDEIYAGMTANVSIPGRMLNLTGTVSDVSTITRISNTGVTCFAVTVEVSNIGSLSVGDSATCTLNGSSGTIYPTITDDNGLEPISKTVVYPGISGKVGTVYVKNNEDVTAGQTLLILESDTLSDELLSASDSLRDAQLSVQSQYDKLDNYTITAPIEGTIVDKYYKEGEKTEIGNVLCTIYDLSYLSFTLYVDELDISMVEVGQKAIVTADAVSGRAYEGVVTKVGINGTTANGVTTYPVTIEITETSGLLPAMNVDVTIVAEEKENVLAIPAGAVERGNRVLRQTADGSTGEGAPEGYEYVIVETGVSDDNFVEIISGLDVGDNVCYIPETSNGGGMFMMMTGGGGMMYGG